MTSLVKLLQAFRSENVFNPWSSSDPLDALPSGASGRTDRLRAHFSCKPSFLLIGEAPGYQGCHFSGVPFTNEKLILAGAIPRISSAFRFTTRDRPWSEPSATVVWRTLKELGMAEKTVLWNSFAWHPFRPGNQLSNRAPTRHELQAGLPVLRAVVEYFEGAKIVPVGKVSEATLAQLGIPSLPAVRHPSMGGAKLFREGLMRLCTS